MTTMVDLKCTARQLARLERSLPSCPDATAVRALLPHVEALREQLVNLCMDVAEEQGDLDGWGRLYEQATAN